MTILDFVKPMLFLPTIANDIKRNISTFINSLFNNMGLKSKIVLLFFLVCSNQINAQKTATVLGQFESGKPGDTAYLESTEGIRYKSVLDKNNSVEFKFAPDISDVYFIKCPKLSTNFMFPIFVEEGTTIKIEIDKELNDIRFDGDPLAKEQNTFYAGLKNYYDAYIKTQNKIDKTKDSSELARLQQKMAGIDKDYQDYYYNWVSNHRESKFSAAVISLYIYKGRADETIAVECFKMLSKAATTDNYVASRLASNLAIYDNTVSSAPIGSKAPDFYIADTSGNAITLADFKGKYLLIDFWASWCGPCRANNPLLKEMYNLYKDKGLELLSISVDTDSNAWKKAIIKDELHWTHGSDLKEYGNNGVAFNYGIQGVPMYILVDSAQNIIFKSLGGDIQETMLKLKEVLGN